MSISPVMSTLITSYVPSSKLKEEDEEYKKIINMLKMLGIEPTGNKAADKIILQSALNNMASSQSKKSANSDYIPFLDIMDSLELSSSGDIDKDYTNTVNEIDYRISYASDDEEKQYYQALRDELDEMYNQNSYDNAVANQFSGSTQLGNLNKFMLM